MRELYFEIYGVMSLWYEGREKKFEIIAKQKKPANFFRILCLSVLRAADTVHNKAAVIFLFDDFG
jgi:hypothetical protein